MKLTNFTVLFLCSALHFISCNSSDKPANQLPVTKKSDSNIVSSATPKETYSKDSIELTEFVRQMYKWKETHNSWNDFYPKSDSRDSAYIGIDWNTQAKREKQLEETNFFSNEFLKNYHNIAKAIDERLKNGTWSWLAGELPPFGNDANPWCNCQEYPDRYWTTLTISRLKRSNNDISFVWTFDNTHYYKAIATRLNNMWKIKYLQGFDPKEFLK
jgi:hypothetical protein